MDHYLTAFERGTLDEDDLAERLVSLRGKGKQLRHRRAELADTLTAKLQTVPPAHLERIADSVTEIIDAGVVTMRKGLIEALIAEVKITGRTRSSRSSASSPTHPHKKPKMGQSRSWDSPGSRVLQHDSAVAVDLGALIVSPRVAGGRVRA
jgi:hypothetical protein